jgi:Holliday junction DNA helicase RuvA
MIIGMVGEVIKKEATFVHVQLPSGLIYKVNVSLFCAATLCLGDISLHITQIIREDMHSMYGFLDSDEKKVFDTLIRLNGIGPSIALAICSTLNPSEFSSALLSANIEAFRKVPGIGPKGAKRILVELGDFVLDSETMSSGSSAFVDAVAALESLGFKKEKIKIVLSTCNSTDTTSLIKEALKKLG